MVFLLNLVVGCVLENFWCMLMYRMFFILGVNVEGGDDVVFGLDLVFGFVNLICIVLLVWEVYDIVIWIL